MKRLVSELLGSRESWASFAASLAELRDAACTIVDAWRALRLRLHGRPVAAAYDLIHESPSLRRLYVSFLGVQILSSRELRVTRTSFLESLESLCAHARRLLDKLGGPSEARVLGSRAAPLAESTRRLADLMSRVCAPASSLMTVVLMLRTITPRHARLLLGLDEREFRSVCKRLGLERTLACSDGELSIYAYRRGSLGELMVSLNDIVWSLLGMLKREAPELVPFEDPMAEHRARARRLLVSASWAPPVELAELYRRARAVPGAWRRSLYAYVLRDRVRSLLNVLPQSDTCYARRVAVSCDLPLRDLLDALMPAVVLRLMELRAIRLGGEACLLEIKINDEWAVSGLGSAARFGALEPQRSASRSASLHGQRRSSGIRGMSS